jgi:hypothetical protein
LLRKNGSDWRKVKVTRLTRTGHGADFVQVQSLGVLHGAKAKAANDFLRIQVRRHYLGIQPETVIRVD